MISSDLSYEEIINILTNTKKKMVLFTFGNIPLMYSRRKLLTNYNKHYGENINKDLETNLKDKYFHIVENDYGTCFYTAQNYYLNDYQKLDNVLYDFYNPVFLKKDELLKVLNDDLKNITTFSYLLNQKTIYKIKGDDHND